MATLKAPTLDSENKIYESHLPTRLSPAELSNAMGAVVGTALDEKIIFVTTLEDVPPGTPVDTLIVLVAA